MRKTILFLFTLLVCSCTNDITVKINKITDAKVLEDKTISSRDRVNFTLDYLQPLDHDNPEGEELLQRVYLSHVGFDRPVVLVTDGYSADRMHYDELAFILNANVIAVSHRFSSNALPETLDYRFLTIEQASTDYHKLVTDFKKIYKKSKWIATGESKGGLAATTYRWKYPDDVDVTVARVAPFLYGMNDRRDEAFFKDEKRKNKVSKIYKLQEEALKRSDNLANLLKTKLPPDHGLYKLYNDKEILELLIYYYSYMFWQYSEGINFVPPPTIGDSALLSTILKPFFGEIAVFVDNDGIAREYLSLTELGTNKITINNGLNFSYDIDKLFSRLLDGIEVPEYNPEIMIEFYKWIKEDGNNMIYIFGEDDPLTRFQIDIGDKTNAKKFFVKGQSHLIRLPSMTNYDDFLITLSTWLE